MRRRAALAFPHELSGLHPGGLSRPQYEYLRFLAGIEGHTAGLASIAAYLGMDAKDVQFNEEPFLIRAGYVVVGRSGRGLLGRSGGVQACNSG